MPVDAHPEDLPGGVPVGMLMASDQGEREGEWTSMFLFLLPRLLPSRLIYSRTGFGLLWSFAIRGSCNCFFFGRNDP